jgi:hypothetical protein
VRRAINKNKTIERKTEQGKIYANAVDVFKHFNIDYSEATQKQSNPSSEVTTQMSNQ